MKAASVAQLKKELQFRSSDELEALCLRLARFKKENKELLTYLLFEQEDEEGYVELVKEYMDEGFDAINTTSYYYIKKSVRKVLRETKKYIRYSGKNETEIELLLHFCHKLRSFSPSIKGNRTLMNIYDRQVALIEKTIGRLHEDLQYDYTLELRKLKN